MSKKIKNTVNAQMEAGENITVGDNNKTESKAVIKGNNNFLLRDSMLMIKDDQSGQTFDFINIKNIHTVIQNYSDKSNNCKIISIVVLSMTYSIISLAQFSLINYYFLMLQTSLFWYLDAQHLSKEKMYRKLSMKVLNEIQLKEQQIKVDPIDYDVYRVFRENYFSLNLIELMMSKTLLTVYGFQLAFSFTIFFFKTLFY